MGILEFLSSMKTGMGETMKPVTDKMSSVRGQMADMIGDDPEQFSKRMQGLASVSAAMTPKMTAPPSGAKRPPQVNSSPAPVMGAAPNPYAPVNYGTMGYGQQMQGGIGSAPTMEQILKALQSRGL